MHDCAKWRKIFVLRKIKKNIPSSSLSAFRDRNLIWERAEKNDDHIEKKISHSRTLQNGLKSFLDEH